MRLERWRPGEGHYLAAAFLLAAFVLATAAVTAQGTGAALPFAAPAPIAALEVVGQLGGRVNALAIQGNYAYLGQGAGLSVLDISNPAAPRRVGLLPTPGIVKRVEVAGGYAYLGLEDGQFTRLLKVVSLGDPTQPLEVGSYVLGYQYGSGYAGMELSVSGDQVYVADISGLRILSVADKAKPAQVSWYDLRGAPYGIAVSGRYAYAVVRLYDDGGSLFSYLLEVLDVAEPTSPREVGSVALTGRAGQLVAGGDYVYLDTSSGLQVFDVTSKANPRRVGSYASGCPGSLCFSLLAVAGDYAYLSQPWLAQGLSQSRLLVISLADKANPQQVGSLQMSDTGPVSIAGDYAYVAGWSGTLYVISLANKGQPQQVGVYQAIGLGPVHYVLVAGDYAYTTYWSRLDVVSVADRARPQVVSSLMLTEEVSSLFVAGEYAYTLSNSGLRVFSVADKAHPVQVGAYGGEPGQPLGGGALFVSSDYAYALGNGLWVISVADKANPRRVGFKASQGDSGLYVAGNYAYVSGGRLRIISVADKANPQEVSSIGPRRGGVNLGSGLSVAGDYAYVADGSAGLRVISVADKLNPREVGFYDTPGEAASISLAGDVAYVSDGRAGLRAISVADPARPQELAWHPSMDGAGVHAAVHPSGEYVYVANGDAGLLVLRLRYGVTPIAPLTKPAPMVPSELVGHIGGQSKAVATDGFYVYAGEGPSLSILDFSDPARPRRVGSVVVPDLVEGVALYGDYAYVAARNAGLRVVSVADKFNPREVGVYYRVRPGMAAEQYWDVAVAGGYAYLASSMGLQVLSLASPAQPTEVASYEVGAQEVTVSGGYLYLAPEGDIFSLADPAHPARLGALPTSYGLWHLAVAGDHAYVNPRGGDIKVISIADKAKPQVVDGSSIDCLPGVSSGTESGGLAVSGNYLYLLCGRYGGSVLKVLSLANPATPAHVGVLDLPGDAFGLAVARDRVYVASYERGLRAVSVADAAHPAELGAYDPLGYAQGVAISGDYAYVADLNRGLSIISVADKARPAHVGIYADRDAALDVAVSGGYAYLGVALAVGSVRNPGLRVISVADPARPALVGTYTATVEGTRSAVAVSEGYAYLVAGEAGLRVVSIVDPTHPIEVGAYVMPSAPVVDVAMSGSYAYLAGGGNAILSLANPREPTKVATLGGRPASGVAAAGGRAYLLDIFGLNVITVTQPTTPTLASFYPAVGPLAASGDYVYASLRAISTQDPVRPRAVTVIPAPQGAVADLAVAGGYAYLTDSYGGLFIYRLHSLLVVPAAQRVEPGATFTVTLELAAIANLGGFQFRLNYDPSLLRLESFTPAQPPAGRTWTALGPQSELGSVTYGSYSFGSGGGPWGGRTLGQAVFTALGRGKAMLGLDKVLVTDTSGRQLGAEAIGGQVQVGEPFRLYLPRVMQAFREQ